MGMWHDLFMPHATATRKRSAMFNKVLTHLLAVVLGAYLALSLASAHLPGMGVWLRDFAKSPGLAACAALVAAIIAYQGISKQVAVAQLSLDNQEMAKRSDTWWEMFEWASNRAFPPDKSAQPLPASVTVSTLTELVSEATTKAQRVACKSVVDTLTRNVEAKPENPFKDPHNSKFDISFANSLQTYIDVSQNSEAASPAAASTLQKIVDAENYLQSILNALSTIEHNETDIMVSSISRTRSIDDGVDAVVKVGGQPVSIIIKFSSAALLSKQTLLKQLRPFYNLGTTPCLVVTSSAFPLLVPELREMRAHVTQWQTESDNPALLRALRSAAALANQD